MAQLTSLQRRGAADAVGAPDQLDSLHAAVVAELGPSPARRDEQLARYTSLHIGGKADLLVVAEDIESLCTVLDLAWQHGVPYRVLGRASNVLVSDGGVRGLVIINRARAIKFLPNAVTAESGASFSALARQCIAQGLAGLEWAIGIPGSVGGAVVGNAGAWGGDVASTLLQASLYVPPGEVVEWSADRFQYAYRSSILKHPSMPGEQRAAVLAAGFELRSAELEQLQEKVKQITARRTALQPPGSTCGSIFKNPPGDYAGRLIEAAGLKGHRVGDAEISAVHANFVVNQGSASAAEVMSLIELARNTVDAEFGIPLETEIELIGQW